VVVSSLTALVTTSVRAQFLGLGAGAADSAPAPASPSATVPTSVPEALGAPVAARVSVADISGQWEGTWVDTKLEKRTFSLYINSVGPRVRAVGTVQGWTCWEVFEGGIEGDRWHLTGIDVLRNQQAKAHYVLDALQLEYRSGELYGFWGDVEQDEGVVHLGQRKALPAGLWCAEALQLEEEAAAPAAAPRKTIGTRALGKDRKGIR
jgi:hypothetical protein